MSTLPILLSAIFAFFATMSAGIFVRRFQRHIGIVCAFSAGVLVALALFDLLPDVIALAPKAQISITMPAITLIVGFLSLYALDNRLSQSSKPDKNGTHRMSSQTVGVFSTAEFCTHGFLEGVAIGVSFQFELGLGIAVALAVVSHDFCDGVSTLTLMINSGNTLKTSMSMLLLDAVAPVLGAASTLFILVQDYFLVFALSFLAGTFFYMGGGSLLPQAHQKNRPIVTATFFLIGLVLILLFSILTKS